MAQADPRKFPFPPAIPALAILISWYLEKKCPLGFPLPEFTRKLGWIFVVFPPMLAAWAIITFKHRHTAVDPLGEVTLIVTQGPFRFTRNPMYLSLMLLYLGCSLVFHLTWGFLFIIPVFLALNFGVIRLEEQHLESKFGETYLKYKKTVRRWI